MQFSPDELSQLAVQASTLAERLEGGFVPVDTGPNGALIAERLGRWQQSVAKDNEAQFNKRLSWDGLAHQQARLALGSLRWPDGTALPAWTEQLNLLLKSLSTPSTASGYRFVDPQTPV